MRNITRRKFNSSLIAGVASSALASKGGPLLAGTASSSRPIAAGPFQPSWESLAAGYKCPDWFRDAKFGIWAHWSAQCVPEQGDWYARHMYMQGHPQYEYHVKHYGHPTKFGFMQIDHLWHAENWNPQELIQLYKRAGAKYFVALANHHDNFDCYDSKYHAWNSVRTGPNKDIVGTWGKIARANGLRFGVSNHSSHAWHWFQVAYGYDADGPLAGVRYDASQLIDANGQGQWWQGLKTEDLYCAPTIVIPEGFTDPRKMIAWHNKHGGYWYENAPQNPGFMKSWATRCKDLLDSYDPDLLYFDDTEIPFGDIGLDVVAHYYNGNMARNGGKLQAVVNAKKLDPAHKPALVEDYERGVATAILAEPWQTDTCIGDWHYERRLFEQHRYKTPAQVIHMLVDIVSKNGNLLLSIPVRGDGTIDADEVAFLESLAKWMPVNGEAIFATRPWRVYGEGPSVRGRAPAGQFGGARDVRSYSDQDIRFTTRDDALYAILMDWPGAAATISSIRPDDGTVQRVELLGADGPLPFTQDAAGVKVTLPAQKTGDYAYALKISGLKLQR